MSLLVPISVLLYWFNEPILEILIFLYSAILFSVSVGCAISFIVALYFRLESFNEIIKSNFKSTDEPAIVNYEIILALINIYHDFKTLTDTINTCYCVQVLLATGFVTFFYLFASFLMYKVIFYKDYQYFGKALGLGLFSTYGALYAYVIIIVSQATILKSRKILKLINNVVKRSKDHRTITMMLSLATLIHENPLIFSSGLIDYDWPLLTSIYNVSITQFIILMQFDMAAQRLRN